MKGLMQLLTTRLHYLLFEIFCSGERLRAAAADHRAILAAIHAKDPEAADQAMRKHVENGFRFLSNLDRDYHQDDDARDHPGAAAP